jgi:Protein of unknown function (DUF3313)
MKRSGNFEEALLRMRSRICNFLYQALRDQLGKKFRLVVQAGPGVMLVQVAITDVQAATPVLRSVTMVIPQARTLSTLK